MMVTTAGRGSISLSLLKIGTAGEIVAGGILVLLEVEVVVDADLGNQVIVEGGIQGNHLAFHQKGLDGVAGRDAQSLAKLIKRHRTGVDKDTVFDFALVLLAESRLHTVDILTHWVSSLDKLPVSPISFFKRS
jgi:hypothetical protein